MNNRIDVNLARVRQYISAIRWLWLLSGLALVSLFVGFAIFLTGHQKLFLQSNFWLTTLSVWGVAVTIASISMRRFRPTNQSVARQIEKRYPELRQALLTAADPQVHLHGNVVLARELNDRVIHHASHHHWGRVISGRQIALLNVVSLLILVGFVGFALLLSSSASGRSNHLLTPQRDAISGVRIEPGSTEIERGSSVTISAQFGDSIPSDVQLVATAQPRVSANFDSANEVSANFNSANEVSANEVSANYDSAVEDSAVEVSEATQGEAFEPQIVPMARGLTEAVFTRFVANIESDVRYSVKYDGGESEQFFLQVFDYPQLIRSDVTLSYPDFTGLTPKQIVDTKRVRTVAGTKLDWQFTINKSLQSCILINEEGERIDAVPQPNQPELFSASILADKDAKWRVELTDAAGRHAKLETTLIVSVVANLPPVIKLAAAADRTVSPLEEWEIAANIEDDFGLLRYGVSYQFNDDVVEAISIDNTQTKDEERDASSSNVDGKQALSQYKFDMESLAATPDQLLSYWFWAEDRDVDGKIRRTNGELYFAEVRPLEEIFRQGQSPGQQQPSQQSPAGAKAEKLLELQKQILAASWNVQTTLSSRIADETWQDDLSVIAQSQSDALDQLQEMKGQLQDAVSKQTAADVVQSMQATINTLKQLKLDSLQDSLSGAIKSEQQSYQGLLKLRSREHEIVQSQQSQSSSSSSSSSKQQQIEQLQLEKDEDRYETQSQATKPNDPAAEQTRQAQDRLKDLAQRQKDLNEQIQQVESALQNAKSEKEQRDALEQLKRLRDAQQDLLQDTDKALEQMQQQESSDSMQQAAEQTQQARENIQQASQSLREGKTSEALAAGTRAEQTLSQTEQDLRQQSSEQLVDSVRSLRSQSEAMVRNQDAINEKLQQPESLDDGTGLRGSNDDEELKAELANQRELLQKLQQQMQETVLEAEKTEPLLSDAIYKAYQQSQTQKIDQQLDVQSRMLEQAMEEQASQVATQTLKDLKQMEDSIAKAGKDILGSSQADLERASAELKKLQNQIDQQLGNPPSDAEAGGQASSSDAKKSDGQAGAEATAQSEQSDEKQQAQSQRGSQGSLQDGGSQSGASQGGGSQSGTSQGGTSQGGASQGGGKGDLLRQIERLSQQQFDQQGKPLSGDGFREFNDGLRDVEQLLDNAEDRATAAGIRQAARAMRAEFKRHSEEPNVDSIEELIASPLRELIDHVGLELQRKMGGNQAIVPLDSDPVPVGYEQAVQIYYEQLGASQ